MSDNSLNLFNFKLTIYLNIKKMAKKFGISDGYQKDKELIEN